MFPVNFVRNLRSLLVSVAAAIPVSALAGADHHMHLHSENGAAVWAAMCDAMPDDCVDEPIPTTAVAAGEAVRALDAAGLEKGTILSVGYFFGVPELAASAFNDPEFVRAENEYVAEQVSRFPERLVGFFSVNPLADYAVAEVRYWASRSGLAGLKLHLANSDVDFDKPEHIEKLRAVIGVANDHALPVVIHLRNLDPDYGYEHAALFIDKVAIQAPAVSFYLAHMAGWGGYDAGTDAAVQAFLDATRDGILDRSMVWFDLAAVVETELPDAICDQLTERLREIGLDRVLLASDWDETDPKAYLELMRNRLGLSAAEWELLLGNEAPYFDQTAD